MICSCKVNKELGKANWLCVGPHPAHHAPHWSNFALQRAAVHADGWPADIRWLLRCRLQVTPMHYNSGTDCPVSRYINIDDCWLAHERDRFAPFTQLLCCIELPRNRRTESGTRDKWLFKVHAIALFCPTSGAGISMQTWILQFNQQNITKLWSVLCKI